MGRTNMRYPYPEAGGISQPQRAAGQPLPFTTEKHTGSGIEPGVSDCEATVFPRRHCTPLPCIYLYLACHTCACVIPHPYMITCFYRSFERRAIKLSFQHELYLP